jgi:hypothetical protein
LDKDQAQSNDVVQVTLGTLTYGGALSVTNVGATPLVAGDQFTLFSAPSAVGDFTSITPSEPGNGLAWDFNPASGVLSVVGAAAPALTWTNLGGGVLEFTFDATSKLVWQTNALSVGLRDNWVDYPGGDTSPVSVTNDPAIPATFFGLQPK